MAYGNLALDLMLSKIHGRLVVLKNGRYDNMPIEVVTATKKVVNVRNITTLTACVHTTRASK
jgi:6-phosphofructokinase 1